MEFLQWFKRFFDLQYDPTTNYNGRERRKEALAAFNSARHIRKRQSCAVSTNTASVSATPSVHKSRAPVSRNPRSSVVATPKPKQNQSTALEKENLRLKRELVHLKKAATAVEKERDFYFEKLREMDELFHNTELHTTTPDEFIQLIQCILYENMDSPTKLNPPSPGPVPLPDVIDDVSTLDLENTTDVSNSPLF